MSSVSTKKCYRSIDFLLDLSTLLLRSGAHTARVVRTVKQFGNYLDLQELAVALTLSTATISLFQDGEQVTKIRKVGAIHVDMKVILEVSHFVKEAESNNYSIDEMERELERISRLKRDYGHLMTTLGAGIGCAAIVKLFGAGINEVVITFVSSFIAAQFRGFSIKLGLNKYLTIICTTVVAVMCASTSRYWGASQLSMVASVLFMIPGVPMVNALVDLKSDYPMIAVGRLSIVFMILLSIAVGFVISAYFLGGIRGVWQ